MQIDNRLFLSAALGVMVSLAGLVWDAQIHIHEHGSLILEPLLNLSEPAATNPGHLIFGFGFLLTAVSVLAGFSLTWIQTHARNSQRISWSVIALPLALSLALAVVGIVAVYFLGQTG
jgi:uncharacterized membrane protein